MLLCRTPSPTPSSSSQAAVRLYWSGERGRKGLGKGKGRREGGERGVGEEKAEVREKERECV